MAKEKQPLTAVQRGKRGAIIGMILVENHYDPDDSC